MALRIAFDLDGVLADMESELVRQAEILFGESMTRRLQQSSEPADATSTPEPTTPVNGDEAPADPQAQPSTPADTMADATPPLLKLQMTARQQRKLWRHVEAIEGFWESLKEIEPGSIKRLAAIAADRRWEVIFLTKRPESAGLTAQVQTQRWLEVNGFTLPSVFVVQGSRGRIAAALGLDIVVDDRPENCLDVVVDSKARAILVWREDEKRLPVAARRLGIGVVKSVAQTLDILTQVDTHDEERPTVVDRFRRLLGMKSPSRT